jgi:hypothetical protein
MDSISKLIEVLVQDCKGLNKKSKKAKTAAEGFGEGVSKGSGPVDVAGFRGSVPRRKPREGRGKRMPK